MSQRTQSRYTLDNLPKSYIASCAGLLIAAQFGIFVIGCGNPRQERKAAVAQCRILSERVKADASDKEALEELVHRLNAGSSFSRTEAVIAIGKAGRNALPAADSVIAAMNSNDGFIEREAVRAIGRVSKGSDVGVAPLLKKLRLENGREIVCFAAESLGEIGSPAKSAIPHLRSVAQQSTDTFITFDAERAIEKIEDAVKQENRE